MAIGIIGLGKMGLNIALNAKDHGWEVYGFDSFFESSEKAKNQGIYVQDTLKDLIERLGKKKIILLSLPSGEPTNSTIDTLKEALSEEDIVIDCGNSNYHESLKHYNELKEKKIRFLDCGTSGGVSGARNGACLMIGGDQNVFDQVENLFKDLSTREGYLFVPQPGAGHFLKMVHNGIEYGMMQAIGEGFSVLEASSYEYDYEKVSKVWNHGSVVRSWLMELAQEAFRHDAKLEEIEGVVDASGEAKWTVQEALDLNVPLPIISTSLFVRNESKLEDSFSNKVVASLRHGFGGHKVTLKEGNPHA